MRRVLPRRLRHGEEATLVEHLGELRARLIIVLVGVTVGFVAAFVVHERIIELLLAPLPDDRRLVTLGVTEPFFTSVKVAAFAGAAAAFPVIVHQLWSFMAPAVAERTQRVMASFVALASVLFAGGVVFGYVVVLPRAVEFLTTYDSELYEIQIRASYYLSFVSLALIGSGIAFELPIFILALVRLGIVTSAQLRRNWRVGVVAVVAGAMLLPTVDPVSFAFEVVPLLILYALSVALATVMERRWARAGVLWRTAPE